MQVHYLLFARRAHWFSRPTRSGVSNLLSNPAPENLA